MITPLITPYDLTYMWNLQKQTKNKSIDTENRLVFARDGVWEMGKMDEGGQKVQTFSYKKNKSCECACSMTTVVGNTVLHIWKLLN